MKNIKSSIIFLLLFAAAGAYAYFFQFSKGLGVTGLNKPVFWGIYIANFIFSVGLSAGGIAVSALVHLLDWREMKNTAVVAEIFSVTFLITAAMFVILDLGQPFRIFYVLRNANFSSPLLWDVIVINSYLLLCLALLFTGKKFLAIISIPAAVALHSVTAWILGLVKGQPGWNTPILAPLFIASAMASGLAGIIIALYLSEKKLGMPEQNNAILRLGTCLFISIPVLAYLLFTEFLTIGYSGSPAHLAVFEEILFGRFAKIFWFDAVVGILAPFVILGLPQLRAQFWIFAASLLVVIGVFAERAYILLPSLMRSGIMERAAVYSPTWVEWTIMLGVYAFGSLIFIFASSLFCKNKNQPLDKSIDWS